jgi:hypothetical protein
MRIPGAGISGVEERVSTNLLLSTHRLPEAINFPPEGTYERWWSWRRLQHLVFVIKSRGVETRGEWQRLATICKVVSRRKKAFLYRELRPLFSPASLEYLFGDFHLPAWEVRE